MAHKHQGLSAAEVAERKRRGETNAFDARVGRSYWQIVRDNVLNLFNIVLFSLLLIVLISRDYATVFFSGFSVVTNSLLGMIQEIAAKRKLDRMAALAAHKVNVWRDETLQNISTKEIVKGDIIAIEPGDRLAVDGIIIESDTLELDESQLTGESDAIFKTEGDEVFSGSFCIAGTGLMQATQVGKNSTINQLSVIAKQYKNELTPTQKKIAAIVELSVLIMFITAPMLLLQGAQLNDEPLNIIRNTVVYVTSLVPQGLVLVAILSLTIGAVKISLHQTLIQRVNAVESMANVTVLCFDKTGTITQNKLAVTQIEPLNGKPVDDIESDLYVYINNLSYQNKTAGAIASYVANGKSDAPVVIKTQEIPFTSSRKWGAIIWNDRTLVLGAPERMIADEGLLAHSKALSTQGMRVLAFAEAENLNGSNPEQTHIQNQCQPLALIVMSDQIREDINATLNDFRELNVKLKVISGDNVETVRSIAGDAGMPNEIAYTGDQLRSMTDAEFENAIQYASVFARIEPDIKRRIILTLKEHGEYVAMVGDGVNDVPALKAANLAIVMNDGTQISKDVADIVLLNNAMSTLPRAFREGREITQTIYGTTKIFLAKNVYNILLFIFVGFMALPFPITPVQISWAAFGTVNMPATFIAFEVIRPKYIEQFRRDVVDYLITAGLIGAIALSIIFVLSYFVNGESLPHARSAITIFICLFSMLIVWNVQGVEIYEPYSFIRHWKVVLISGIAGVLTILSFYAAAPLFQFIPPDPGTASGIQIIVLITALFCLSIVLVSHGMKYRYLLDRMWMLFAPGKHSQVQ